MLDSKAIEIICNIICEAGKIALKYHKNISSYQQKQDGSEVTIADIEVNNFICKNLQKYFPEISIVSEENDEMQNINNIKKDKYFIIDPIDGTRNFIAKKDNFTVNIAFIKDFKAEFGAIFCPVKNELYFTKNNKSYKKIDNKITEIKTSDNLTKLILLSTKREPERTEIIELMQQKSFDIKEYKTISSSYKFCIIADGKADIYPRNISIKSWDIAAGVAIINKAGGSVVESNDNSEIIFNEINAPKFICHNGKISWS